MLDHDGDRHLCTICGKTYKLQKYLATHMNQEHDAPHKCKYCGLKFHELPKFDEHENLHTIAAQPFTCVLCETIVSNTMELRHHVEKVHSVNPNICDICGKRFCTQRVLLEHKNIHDPSFVGHKCQECGFVFTNKYGLQRHMPKHTNEKKFVCSLCGLAFKYNAALVLHKRRHNQEYRYQCNVCDRKFLTGHFLKHHEQSHSDIRSYVCPLCGKGFKTHANLLQHSYTHMPDRVKKKRIRSRPKKKVEEEDEEEGNPSEQEMNSKPKAKRQRRGKSPPKRKGKRKASQIYDDDSSSESMDSAEEYEETPDASASRTPQNELLSAVSSIVQNEQYTNAPSVPTLTLHHGHYDMPNLSFQSPVRNEQLGRNQASTCQVPYTAEVEVRSLRHDQLYLN